MSTNNEQEFIEPRWLDGSGVIKLPKTESKHKDQGERWLEDYGLTSLFISGDEVVGVSVWEREEENGSHTFFISMTDADRWEVWCTRSVKEAFEFAGHVAQLAGLAILDLLYDEVEDAKKRLPRAR